MSDRLRDLWRHGLPEMLGWLVLALIWWGSMAFMIGYLIYCVATGGCEVEQ